MKTEDKSIGIRYQDTINYDDNSFVGSVDGMTFGIDHEGIPFNTASTAWPLEDQARWAEANSRLFRDIAAKLSAYASAVKELRNLKRKEEHKP